MRLFTFLTWSHVSFIIIFEHFVNVVFVNTIAILFKYLSMEMINNASKEQVWQTPA